MTIFAIFLSSFIVIHRFFIFICIYIFCYLVVATGCQGRRGMDRHLARSATHQRAQCYLAMHCNSRKLSLFWECCNENECVQLVYHVIFLTFFCALKFIGISDIISYCFCNEIPLKRSTIKKRRKK